MPEACASGVTGLCSTPAPIVATVAAAVHAANARIDTRPVCGLAWRPRRACAAGLCRNLRGGGRGRRALLASYMPACGNILATRFCLPTIHINHVATPSRLPQPYLTSMTCIAQPSGRSHCTMAGPMVRSRPEVASRRSYATLVGLDVRHDRMGVYLPSCARRAG